ncbi:MAG: FadR family transcriptional regulator [Fidelibacterota bacterium]|nr:MAG: FadR family transcriptional regulator [Candidatus Neomarinimicrobiota bacterium]
MDKTFKQIGNNTTLSQQIVQQVEDSIRNKVLLPGQKLPTEQEMSAIFGVSRPALREALQILSTRGLITIRKGRGAFVNDYHETLASNPMHLYLELNLNKDLILQLVAIRKILEPNIARLAAENRTATDLEELQAILNQFEHVSDTDHEKQGELDRDFHLKLAHSTQNPIIPLIVDPVFQMMPKIKTIILEHVEQAHGSAVEHHRRILDEIEAGDAEGAYREMLEHMSIAEEHAQVTARAME